eukprot:CAMPEP_0174706054 /NCGR_PEP_ID=MMETSP1094-20130205/9045_1 /TAXON_ID=156173 /ORGANISM="Chrysochromulina brevifilum, Strain UTEX LB 985" /LENGTH=116 /DNA_ID=CAMNT_0015904279 /DNA_START=483 /DNA_END=831 /DNA_ORIENTATION=-
MEWVWLAPLATQLQALRSEAAQLEEQYRVWQEPKSRPRVATRPGASGRTRKDAAVSWAAKDAEAFQVAAPHVATWAPHAWLAGVLLASCLMLTLFLDLSFTSGSGPAPNRSTSPSW